MVLASKLKCNNSFNEIRRTIYNHSNTILILMSKWRLFNFKVLQCGTYWKAALKTRRYLFKMKLHYSYKVLKFFHCFIASNNKYYHYDV